MGAEVGPVWVNCDARWGSNWEAKGPDERLLRCKSHLLKIKSV